MNFLNNIFTYKTSQFSSSSTAFEVLKDVNCDGKIAIITGANNGIGYETARSMSISGIKVIMGCRNLNLAHQAIEKIKKEKLSADLLAIHLDLADLKSVQKFVDSFLNLNLKLDILICNAGLYTDQIEWTVDNLEIIFQVNYLSNFYLIQLLEEKLIQSASSRIVFLSSSLHNLSKLTKWNICGRFLSSINNCNYPIICYANSKLCINLLARYLARKYKHLNITTYSVHPGLIKTKIIWIFKMVDYIPNFISKMFLKSLQQGASTTVYCACYPNIEQLSGSYFADCKQVRPSSASEDDDLADKLWTISNQMLHQWKHHKLNLQK